MYYVACVQEALHDTQYKAAKNVCSAVTQHRVVHAHCQVICKPAGMNHACEIVDDISNTCMHTVLWTATLSNTVMHLTIKWSHTRHLISAMLHSVATVTTVTVCISCLSCLRVCRQSYLH